MSSVSAAARPTSFRLNTRRLSFVPSALIVIALTVFVSLPLYSMIVTSIKTDKEIYDDFTYIPRQPTLVQFQRVIERERFLTNIRNSVIVATTSTVVAVTMSVLAAYAVVRLRFHGRVWIARLILFKYL